jgi:hypothetical protein
VDNVTFKWSSASLKAVQDFLKPLFDTIKVPVEATKNLKALALSYQNSK